MMYETLPNGTYLRHTGEEGSPWIASIAFPDGKGTFTYVQENGTTKGEAISNLRTRVFSVRKQLEDKILGMDDEKALLEKEYALIDSWL